MRHGGRGLERLVRWPVVGTVLRNRYAPAELTPFRTSKKRAKLLIYKWCRCPDSNWGPTDYELLVIAFHAATNPHKMNPILRMQNNYLGRMLAIVTNTP